MPRILILARCPLLGVGIRSTLEQMTDWEVSLFARKEIAYLTLDSLAELARQYMPDVTILEDTAGDTLDLFGQLAQRLGKESVTKLGMKVVVTRGYQCEETLFKLQMWGVAAYLSTRIPLVAFVNTVHRVSLGEWLLSGEELYCVPPIQREQPSPAAIPSGCPLTSRELEVLKLLAQGKINKEIARALSIRAQTVKNHITTICRKLAVPGRMPAIIKALKQGWIELPAQPVAAQASYASVA